MINQLRVALEFQHNNKKFVSDIGVRINRFFNRHSATLEIKSVFVFCVFIITPKFLFFLAKLIFRNPKIPLFYVVQINVVNVKNDDDKKQYQNRHQKYHHLGNIIRQFTPPGIIQDCSIQIIYQVYRVNDQADNDDNCQKNCNTFGFVQFGKEFFLNVLPCQG